MSKTIVLLHGFPLDGSSWGPQRVALEAAGHRVLTPDLPPTAAEDSAWTIELLAGYVRQVIQEEGGGAAVVGGLSMGGYVLQALLRAHPECVAAAIFMDTKFEADSAEARAGRLNTIEDVKAHGTAGLIETMAGKLLSAGAKEGVKEELRGIMRKQSAEKVCALQWAMANRRNQSDLPAMIRVPTLFVVGSADGLTPPAMMRGMAERTPGSQFVEISGAGHQSNLERPEEVNAALLGFLKTV